MATVISKFGSNAGEWKSVYLSKYGMYSSIMLVLKLGFYVNIDIFKHRSG